MRGAIFIALMATGALSTYSCPARSDCLVTHSVGLDTTQTNRLLSLLEGGAWGEVIQANATSIASFTVWRKAYPDSLFDPMHLYITEVSSAGQPLVDHVLEDGPDLVIPVAQQPGQPVEVRYEFDPPFQLPSPGKYWFAIREGSCFVFALLANDANAFPDGSAWGIPHGSCQGLYGTPYDYGGNFDLIFDIEFCDAPITAQSGSWGSVKARYR